MEIEEKAENPNSEENPNEDDQEEHEEITIEKQKNPL